MKCDEFLAALETGRFLQRMRARCHAVRCQRCALEHAAFAEALRCWATPEPLSAETRRLWQRAAVEVTARPVRGSAWKLVTAGALATACLMAICLLGIVQHIHKSPVPVSGPTLARNESRVVSPITVEEINPSEGLASWSNEIERLSIELKELQQGIERKQLQSQVAATLERFGTEPSPIPE